MSYNILSQDLLQDNAYLYRHCNPRVLPWSHRLPNLLAEIQQYNADVSGLDHQKLSRSPHRDINYMVKSMWTLLPYCLNG